MCKSILVRFSFVGDNKALNLKQKNIANINIDAIKREGIENRKIHSKLVLPNSGTKLSFPPFPVGSFLSVTHQKWRSGKKQWGDSLLLLMLMKRGPVSSSSQPAGTYRSAAHWWLYYWNIVLWSTSTAAGNSTDFKPPQAANEIYNRLTKCASHSSLKSPGVS